MHHNYILCCWRHGIYTSVAKDSVCDICYPETRIGYSAPVQVCAPQPLMLSHRPKTWRQPEISHLNPGDYLVSSLYSRHRFWEIPRPFPYDVRASEAMQQWQKLVPTNVAIAQVQWDRLRDVIRMRSMGMFYRQVGARLGVSSARAQQLNDRAKWVRETTAVIFGEWLSPVMAWAKNPADLERLAHAA